MPKIRRHLCFADGAADGPLRRRPTEAEIGEAALCARVQPPHVGQTTRRELGGWYFRRRPWGDERLYVLPLALLRKTPATSNVDLRDETGAALSLLSREEDAAITERALGAAIDALVDVPEPTRPRLNRYVHGLVRETDPVRQGAYVASTVRLIALLLDTDAEGADFRRLHQLLRDVAANSVIWLELTGTPRQRRIVKLAYDIALEPTPLWPRRAQWREYLIELEESGDGDADAFELFDRGDGSDRSAPSRLWNRVATTIGWAAVDVTVDSPYLRGASSYHLQFNPPPGTEVRTMNLRAELLNADGEHCEPEVNDRERDRGHLYFSRLRVKRDGPAELSVRVGRRGYLSHCTLAAAVIAGMLWGFANYADRAAQEPEVAAATLLLVPTLLAVFVARPGEHVLVARQLSGVRAIVFLCGLLSAAAAAALAGAHPFEHDQISRAWHWYAWIATVSTALLAVSVALASDTIERLRRLSRRWAGSDTVYASMTVAIAVVAAAAVLAAPAEPGYLSGARTILAVVVLGATAVAAAWWSQFADANRHDVESLRVRRLLSVLLALEAVGAVLAALLVADLNAGVVTWSDLYGWLAGGALVTLLATIALELIRRLGVLPPIEDAEQEPWNVDYPDHDVVSSARGRDRSRGRHSVCGLRSNKQMTAPSAWLRLVACCVLFHDSPIRCLA